MKLRLAILLFQLLAISFAFAETPYKLTRISGEIKLDGVIDEAAWDNIAPFPLVMYQPTYKGEISESTEIRVGYDDSYIYMSGKLYHVNPADMRGNSLYRDRYSGDDTFAIVLDSFNDDENALWFFTNPLGNRWDTEVINDALGGRSASSNSDWNTHWDVATQMTDDGWFAEFRIPFSSLKFQDDDGRVVMGMIVYRFISHNNSRYIWPDIPPVYDRGANKPSVAHDVEFEGIYSKKPVYITPYALAGRDQVSNLNAAETAYNIDDDNSVEAGFDLKYNLTNNLTLDLTVNTDFAQAEADDQQVNLTRFSLFFPEKRQFFQERAGIFEFRFDRSNRLFHSRRIGLNDGEPIRIFGGGRMVGRVGQWDIGLLNMQTAKADTLPSENFGVLRLRRNVINPYSDLGAMLTTRLDNDGNYNLAYGLDSRIRVFGDDYLTMKWAQTREKASEGMPGPDFFESSRLYLTWIRERQQGFTYDLTLSRAGGEFDPGVGFEFREDYFFLFGGLNYQWLLTDRPWLRRIQIGNWNGTYLRNSDNEPETIFWRTFMDLESKDGASIEAAIRYSEEDVEEGFELSESINVPQGTYRFADVELEYRGPSGWRFRPGAEVSGGSFYDGRRLSLEIDPSWIVSRYLEFRPSYEVNYLSFSDRDQTDTIHLAQLRINAALNTQVSLSAFTQYNSSADLFTMNARFRYNFSEGSDLWLVYNEGINTDLNLTAFDDSPRLTRLNNRALLFKYTYTFIR